MVIWNILQPFGKFYDNLVRFVFIWHIFTSLGIAHQEKSGNPAQEQKSTSIVYSIILQSSKIYVIKISSYFMGTESLRCS
jgi:hypothetical protein